MQELTDFTRRDNPVFDLRRLGVYLAQHARAHVLHYEGAEPQRTSYAQLARDVTRAAARLREARLSDGGRLGILGTNSYAWIVWDLAALAERCRLIAIPPETARRDLAELCEELDLAHLLVSRDILLECGPSPRFVSSLASLGESVLSSRAVQRTVEPDPDFLAPSSIFSSGSTGRLRSMLTSRRGCQEMIESFAHDFALGAADTMLVFLPLSNYQQRVMVYAAVWKGANIALGDGQRLFRVMREGKPTVIIAPPAFYEGIRLQCGAHASSHGASAALGGAVRCLITGMAPIRGSTLEFFSKAGLPLFEAYGITEAGIVAWNRPGQIRAGSVGKPVRNTHVELAADGEVIVQKLHLNTLGYVDEKDQDGIYLGDGRVATGDVGRFDQDGFLYLIGRKKEIIVTHTGCKIHPEVVEQRVNACSAVRECAAFGGVEGRVISVAVVIDATASEAEKDLVRQHLRAVNRALDRCARVTHLSFAIAPFSIENGMLTRNLKLNRRAIAASFAAKPAEAVVLDL